MQFVAALFMGAIAVFSVAVSRQHVFKKIT